MAEENFADRLLTAVETKRSHVVLGLDPAYELLPPEVRAAHPRDAYDGEADMKLACYRDFLGNLLDGLRLQAVAVKPQIAYFEALGGGGYALYLDVVRMAKERGYVVIADVKRGDIGSTAEAYAQAHLDVAGADAVTVNPYFRHRLPGTVSPYPPGRQRGIRPGEAPIRSSRRLQTFRSPRWALLLRR